MLLQKIKVILFTFAFKEFAKLLFISEFMMTTMVFDGNNIKDNKLVITIIHFRILVIEE